LSTVKLLDGPRVHGISPVGKEKVYEGKDLNDITAADLSDL